MKNIFILVTGATGYVGGRLVPILLNRGFRVRAMARNPKKLLSRHWSTHPLLDVVSGDVLNPESLDFATRGCTHIFYLVHSMIARKKAYAHADQRAAENMIRAADKNGVERIIYLGGLGDINHPLISPHLLSRHQVGEILKSGKTPVTIFRAAMILGSGSASFEILRYLTERLPIMITPRWVHMKTQPISIENVLNYLAEAVENEETKGRTFDIGGPESHSYAELFRIYAQAARLLPRILIPVPFLTPWLSARWIHLVTPVPASIAQPLAEGLCLPTVCTENSIASIIPQNLKTSRETIETALNDQEVIPGSKKTNPRPQEWSIPGDASWAGGTVMNCFFKRTIPVPASSVWKTISEIGGENGWYSNSYLWNLRGVLDFMVGGTGIRKGRKPASEIEAGDALDFWRVLKFSPGKRLILQAEMRFPGEAFLDISLESQGDGATEIKLLSRFIPRGLWGLAYGYALLPLHDYIFKSMLSGIEEASIKLHSFQQAKSKG